MLKFRKGSSQGVRIDNHYGRAGTDELFMYDCIATENPIIVNMVKTYFDVFWWRGERPQGLIMARQGRVLCGFRSPVKSAGMENQCQRYRLGLQKIVQRQSPV